MKDVLKFFKTKIKKGKKIPISFFNRLLNCKDTGGKIDKKLLRPSKLRKYIALNEEGHPVVKRGGEGFWDNIGSVIPNLIKQGQETFDFIKDSKVKQQQRDNQEIQNKIDKLKLQRELQSLENGENPNQEPIDPSGEGCGRKKISKEEFLMRMKKGREAKARRLKVAGGF